MPESTGNRKVDEKRRTRTKHRLTATYIEGNKRVGAQHGDRNTIKERAGGVEKSEVSQKATSGTHSWTPRSVKGRV